jgi:hypothetical protein
MRLRVVLVLIGALLVAATYTFPLWQPILSPQAGSSADTAFPGLSGELAQTFAILPAEQQEAYLAVADEDLARGLAMVTSALSPRQEAPEDDEELPTLIDPLIVAVGAFARLDAIRWGQGEATVYLSSNEPPLLRLDNFSVANGPDLRLAFSPAVQPTTPFDMRQPSETSSGAVEIGSLKGVYGSQNFTLPAGLDVRQFGSLVIYSQSLDMIYTIAPLFIRG